MKNSSEQHENLSTEELIDSLSEDQLSRIADRIKNHQNQPVENEKPKIVPPVIDRQKEEKEIFQGNFREYLRKKLKECFSMSLELSSDEMAFIRKIKGQFIQKQTVTIEDAKRLNEITTRVLNTRIKTAL